MVLPASHGIPRVPWYSGCARRPSRFRLQGFHLLRPSFPAAFGYPSDSPRPTVVRPGTPSTPIMQRRRPSPHDGFGLLPFRSPLLRESLLLSFPRGTKMFQFPRSRFPCLWVQHGMPWVPPRRVPPFGYPRISACLQLPGAFRRLPRPSSPPCA